jgi:membrane protease YdiL (CAAX protease family)
MSWISQKVKSCIFFKPKLKPISNIEAFLYLFFISVILLLNFIPWDIPLSNSEKMMNYHQFASGLIGILFLRFKIKETSKKEEDLEKEYNLDVLSRVLFWVFFAFLVIYLIYKLIFASLNPPVFISSQKNYYFFRAISVVFCEELLYRGVFIGVFLNSNSDTEPNLFKMTGICLLSTILWVTFHFNYASNPPMLIDLLTTGFIFGILYFLSKNIKISIAFHLGNNLFYSLMVLGFIFS